MASHQPIPFSEPPWLCGLPSPYYKETHRKWQKACREFLSANVTEHAMEWEREGEIPKHLFLKLANANFLTPNLPQPLPVKLLKSLGLGMIGGVIPVEEFDYFHTMIYWDELLHSGLHGIASALAAGFAFGVPPLIKYGSPELQVKFLPDLLRGTKRSCIAVTEPEAGSDVANIHTTAEKSKCGKFYIVNGTKKWITNGLWAEYSTMAVRTGGSGASGLSLLVVPLLGHLGVTMRKMHVGGQHTSGTTFIELDDVQVPVGNLIGQEGKGMIYIMQNFNHERFNIIVNVTRQSRVTLSAAFEYCLKREAFGKALMDQAVVRHRLAKAGALLESLSAWSEQFAYQLANMTKVDADKKLGGLTAMAKAQAGIVLDECARCSVLLFGGNGYTKSGQGEIAERIFREINAARIPGGSEDVMLDLGVRQLVKLYKSASAELERPRGGSRL